MTEFNVDEWKDNPDFNAFVDGVVSKKKSKWAEDYAGMQKTANQHATEQATELEKLRTELAQKTTTIETSTASKSELEQRIEALTREAGQAKIQNGIMTEASKRNPKNLAVVVSLLATQAGYNEEGSLMVGEQSISEHLDNMVNDKSTSFLFGSEPQNGSGLSKTTEPANQKTDSELLKEAGF